MDSLVKNWFDFARNIKRNGLVLFLFIFMSALTALPEARAEVATADEPERKPFGLDGHAFISQGFLKTTSNNYLGNSQQGSFDFTEIGINVTKALSKNIDMGAQLFSRKLGPSENFNVKFDWFYVGYQFSNWLRFKVGRIKMPFGLYNEMSDIDSARIPVLLPQSVYPTQSRNFLLASNGAQVYGFGDLGRAGSLGYHLYGGAVSIDFPSVTSVALIITQISAPYLAGGRLVWETPIEGLKTAFTLQKMRLDLNATVGTATVSAHVPATQYVGSVEYAFHKLLLTSEYSRWYVALESSNPKLVAQTNTASERYYAMGTYQLTDVFAPGVYYSVLTPDISNRGGHQRNQGDLALFLRYDFNPHWLVKLEGHIMNGTAGLDSSLNNSQSLSVLQNSWEVFMVKTTAYF